LRVQQTSNRKKGILHGVPFAVKDIIDTFDLPTAWGSPIYAGFQAPRNASCVEMLLLAGAIPIGKTVTTEFAYFSPGPTRNPHNLGTYSRRLI
jgi:amidase